MFSFLFSVCFGMMLKGQRSQQRLAVILLMVVTIVQCQDGESRRAVTEHQLMHDRGRSIQSLKRLIWLSSAIEGLHTAQTRTLTAGDPETRPGHFLTQPGHRRTLETLLNDMYRPHLTAVLGDREK
ncbi:parathyroid hormone 4-like isoform X1 [Misgurnus anguillicaudatus]|uniref:parathyroid hormone 4-like isoform X1 n=2 Tax=Misgurnus anguillicaudatus TaxID=75329 RepID=UPI003CCF23D8